MTEPKITPLARRLAEENGIDWHNLEGTGPDGTIVERDILAFLAKVMAGEVELPPDPAEATPPETVPDISEVQEALAREGVDLGELVPETVSETTPGQESAVGAEETFVEEEAFFEMDFDGIEEGEPLEAAAVANGLTADAPAENAFDEGWTVVDSGEELPPEPEPAAPGSTAEPATEVPELGWEEALETAPEPEEAAFEWEAPQAPEAVPEPGEELEVEVFEEFEFVEEETALETPLEAGAAEAPPTFEAPAEAEAAATEVHEASPEEEVPVEGAAEIAPAPAASVEEGFEEVTEPPEAEAPAADLEAATAGAPETESEPPEQETPVGDETEPAVTVAAASPGAVFPPAFRRAVDLGAAERARADLSTAWRSEVPLELLLFRAVDRALAELEVPMRPVLGRFEGEEARALAVQPAVGLRDLYEHLLHAEEGGEGLIVLDLSETPYAEVILPDRALVTLGRAGLPEGLGLLSISGELPTDRTRFLERVAFYLERPILLA